MNVTVAPGAQIKGSRETSLEAFAVWSHDGSGHGRDALRRHHRSGAASTTAGGHLLAGTFTDQKGNTFMYTPAQRHDAGEPVE